MNGGYVRVYRKTIDSQVFQNEGLLKVWLWCLLRANHKEQWVSITTGRGTTEVHLLPGQFIFGRKTAAKELKMKPSTVRNRIQKLKNMRNLDIQTDTHYSIIIVLNWDTYQVPNKKEDRQEDNQRTGKGQPKDTDKNDKNDKKIIHTSVPHQKIIDLYHAILPELPEVIKWTPARKAMLKARWDEDKEVQNLKWWEGYFKHVSQSKFLMGKSRPPAGREVPFQADLEWLIRPSNFVKVREGKYH